MTTPAQLSPEEVWQRYDRMEARLSAPLSERMLALAGIRPQMRVLDLCTGRGEPAILAAHRVGPAGAVLGVDVSAGMLAMARARADEEGLTNLELRQADAASLDGTLPAHFDATLARWGLMYMNAPVQALIAARRAMLPAGVLVVAVWAEPERVSYYSLPRDLLRKYRALPEIDFSVPGEFYYSDPKRLQEDFQRAGFHIDHIEEMAIPVMEAETAAELVAWVRTFGLARLMAGLPEQAQSAWENDLVAAAEELRQDGLFRLGGVTRIVVARPVPVSSAGDHAA